MLAESELPPFRQRTTNGCLCDTNCWGHESDCYAFERCITSVSALDDGDDDKCRLLPNDPPLICSFEPPKPSYQNQTAQAKLDYLWSRIITTSNASAPIRDDPIDALTKMTQQSFVTTYELQSDEQPPGRPKTAYEHGGAVAKVTFRVATTDENDKPIHPFTGLLATGSETCLLRISTIIPLPVTRPTPGISLKCLVDYEPSVNFVGLVRSEGIDTYDLFRNNFSSQVPPTHEDILQDQSLATLRFRLFSDKVIMQTTRCPPMVGLSEWALLGMDNISQVVIPYGMVFTANDALEAAFVDRTDTDGDGSADPFDSETLMTFLEEFPLTNTSLFTIHGRKNPGDDYNIPIGSLVLQTPFTRSSYADEQLFFKHQYMEQDFRLRPDWLDKIDSMEACGVPNVSTTPPSILLRHGMSQDEGVASCPFAKEAWIKNFPVPPTDDEVDPPSAASNADDDTSSSPFPMTIITTSFTAGAVIMVLIRWLL